ncbi:MAG: hypothetical protein KC713_05030, partial [Candidatus Omnitrophica bacterium]|nr:hypothetical protein [Candidatus Omnitrophota bacterium]
IQADRKNRLWVVDNGNGPVVQAPRIFAFDMSTEELVFSYTFPEDVGPQGSFLQDLAVDDENEFVYLADTGINFSPAIVVLDVINRRSRRFEDHFSLQSEDVDLIVDGRRIEIEADDGAPRPVRVGINPITLSPDMEKLYYGAMTGESWYYIPTRLFREWADDEKIQRFIYIQGEKPISDGASTDLEGNHFFTNVGNNAIDRLDALKDLETFVRDDRLSWPDALSFGPDGWLYIAVNQLHRSPRFNQGQEGAQLPYLIMRVKTGTQGIPGR